MLKTLKITLATLVLISWFFALIVASQIHTFVPVVDAFLLLGTLFGGIPIVKFLFTKIGKIGQN